MSPSIVGHPPATDYLPCSRAPQPPSRVEAATQRPRPFCVLILSGMQTRWFDYPEDYQRHREFLLKHNISHLPFSYRDAEKQYQMDDTL